MPSTTQGLWFYHTRVSPRLMQVSLCMGIVNDSYSISFPGFIIIIMIIRVPMHLWNLEKYFEFCKTCYTSGIILELQCIFIEILEIQCITFGKFIRLENYLRVGTDCPEFPADVIKKANLAMNRVGHSKLYNELYNVGWANRFMPDRSAGNLEQSVPTVCPISVPKNVFCHSISAYSVKFYLL